MTISPWDYYNDAKKAHISLYRVASMRSQG